MTISKMLATIVGKIQPLSRSFHNQCTVVRPPTAFAPKYRKQNEKHSDGAAYERKAASKLDYDTAQALRHAYCSSVSYDEKRNEFTFTCCDN